MINVISIWGLAPLGNECDFLYLISIIMIPILILWLIFFTIWMVFLPWYWINKKFTFLDKSIQLNIFIHNVQMAMNISKTAHSLVTIAYVGLKNGPQTKITGPEEGYKLGKLVIFARLLLSRLSLYRKWHCI